MIAEQLVEFALLGCSQVIKKLQIRQCLRVNSGKIRGVRLAIWIELALKPLPAHECCTANKKYGYAGLANCSYQIDKR